MFRFFCFVTLFSFFAEPYSAHAMEAELPEGSTEHSLNRRGPVLNNLVIEATADVNPSRLLVDPEEELVLSSSEPVVESPKDEISGAPTQTFFGSVVSVFFFWQTTQVPSEGPKVSGGQVQPLSMEDFEFLLDPDAKGNSASLLDEDEISPKIGEASNSTQSIIAEMDDENYGFIMIENPDEPIVGEDGSVNFRSMEAGLRYFNALKELEDFEEKVASGEIILNNDPEYWKKHIVKSSKAVISFAVENFGPILGYSVVRAGINILYSEWGLWAIQLFGNFTAREVSGLTSFLAKVDITGFTPWLATKFAESQARGEALRHLGDIANLVERHGLTVLLTSANLAVTTYNYTSTAVKGTCNTVRTVASYSYSGMRYIVNVAADGTMYVVSQVIPQPTESIIE